MSERYWCRLPSVMADDPPMAASYWRMQVEAAGQTPVGEPEIRRLDQVTVNGELIHPDAPPTSYIAIGTVA